MTSGNLSDEPIGTDDAEALDRLAGLADAFLPHDRPIHVPVRRLGDRGRATAARAAGAPVARLRAAAASTLPVASPAAAGRRRRAEEHLLPGRGARTPGCRRTSATWRTCATLTRLRARRRRTWPRCTGVEPEHVVARPPPGYLLRRWARVELRRPSRPLRRAAPPRARRRRLMAEHGLAAASRCIGVAFDGTGYGDDGTVWGGEMLLADYRRLPAGRRTCAYVPLPGGDAAVRQPVPDGAGAPARGRASDWDRRPAAASPACPTDRARGVLAPPARDRVCGCAADLRAWAGCSTRWPALLGICAPGRPTRPRRPWSSRRWPRPRARSRDVPVVDWSRRSPTEDPLVSTRAGRSRRWPATCCAGRRPATGRRAFHAAVADVGRRRLAGVRDGAPALVTVGLTGGVFQNVPAHRVCARDRLERLRGARPGSRPTTAASARTTVASRSASAARRRRPSSSGRRMNAMCLGIPGQGRRDLARTTARRMAHGRLRRRHARRSAWRTCPTSRSATTRSSTSASRSAARREVGAGDARRCSSRSG